jgi:hypothetical protein
VNPKTILKKFTMQDIEDHYIRDLECLTRSKVEITENQKDKDVEDGGPGAVGRVYKHVVIVDLKGFSMAHMGSSFRNPMRKTIGLLEYFYPECCVKIYVINAPMAFYALWKIVSPWLHPVTRAYVNVLGGVAEFRPVLKQCGIGQGQLPRSLGGTLPEDGYITNQCAIADNNKKTGAKLAHTPYGRAAAAEQPEPETDYDSDATDATTMTDITEVIGDGYETSHLVKHEREVHSYTQTVRRGTKEMYYFQYKKHHAKVVYSMCVSGAHEGCDIGFSIWLDGAVQT